MFEVVFMETAGWIIVGAICERMTYPEDALAVAHASYGSVESPKASR